MKLAIAGILAILAAASLPRLVDVDQVRAQSMPAGLGASTFNCVDVDGDGYGVGPGCTGPDADDNDASVHDAAGVFALYTDMAGYLSHMGWSPSRVLYVDGGAGTCTRLTSPFTYSSGSACVTVDAAITAMSAGDAVVVRSAGSGATRTTQISIKWGTLSGTTCTAYNYYLAYPGEQPDFEFDNSSGGTAGIGFAVSGAQSCIVIDGWKLHQACLGAGTCITGGYGVANSGTIYGLTISHNDIGGFTDDLHPQFNHFGTAIRHNYLHDAYPGGDFGHIIYLGSDCPGGIPGSSCTSGLESSGSIIQGNIFNGGWNTCIHANGPMNNILIDSNMLINCHKPFLFQDGLNHSTITNNIAHTSGNQVLGWDAYANGLATQPWQCHNQNYNTIANNTFFMDGQDFTLFATYPVGTASGPQGQSGAYAAIWVLADVTGGVSCESETTVTGSITSGSPNITVSDGTNITVGKIVLGTGIPASTYVLSGSGTSWVLTQNATATNGSVSLAFVPDQGHNIYSNNVLVHSCGGTCRFNVSTTATAITVGNPNITVASSGIGIAAGQPVYGNGILAGTTVQSGSGVNWVLSQNVVSGASMGETVTFLEASNNGPILRYQSQGTQSIATTYLVSDTWANNLLKNFDTAANVIDPLGNNGFQNCVWFTNATNVPGGSGTVCDTDPQLVAANPTWITTPQNWNLAVLSGSPALTAALAMYAPTLDIKGITRSMTTPTIGAYEQAQGAIVPSVSLSGASLLSGRVSR